MIALIVVVVIIVVVVVVVVSVGNRMDKQISLQSYNTILRTIKQKIYIHIYKTQRVNYCRVELIWVLCLVIGL